MTMQHVSSHTSSDQIHPCLASETRKGWHIQGNMLELPGYLSDKVKRHFVVMLRVSERFYCSDKHWARLASQSPPFFSALIHVQYQEMGDFWSLEEKGRNKSDRIHSTKADSCNGHPLSAFLQVLNSRRQARLSTPKSYE